MVSGTNGAFASLRLWDVLRAARERHASDVHLISGLPPAVRIAGELVALAGRPISSEEMTEMLRLTLDQEQRSRLARDADITVTIEHPECATMRVHASIVHGGTSLAIRLLSMTIPNLEELALPAIVATLLERKHGLLIFSGPTGSGKSTSLAAAIDHLNTIGSRRIICIEDPIEYLHENKRSVITQRQIGRDVASFPSAIQSALRCDPDVILIGEMREASTIRAALQAAETGHLVLSTLHTGDAPQSVDRIVDSLADQEQRSIRATLANVLIGIISQRLVRRRSGKRMRAVFEVLVANDAVRNLIRDGKSHQIRNAMVMSRDQGMQSFDHHLAELIACGEVEGREAARISVALPIERDRSRSGDAR